MSQQQTELTPVEVPCGTCMFCGKPSSIWVADQKLARRCKVWIEANPSTRMFVQKAFKGFDADDRETMLTGSHGACFDLAFTEPEEADRIEE